MVAEAAEKETGKAPAAPLDLAGWKRYRPTFAYEPRLDVASAPIV